MKMLLNLLHLEKRKQTLWQNISNLKTRQDQTKPKIKKRQKQKKKKKKKKKKISKK